AAETAVGNALAQARIVATTAGLSAKTKAAATAAATALKDAKDRLEAVTIQEFTDKVHEMTLPIELDGIEVHRGGNVVATANKAKWAMAQAELTVDHITWKVSDGMIATYKNKVVVVSGKHKNDHPWQNDMKLVSGAANSSTAKFKGVH